MSGYWATGSKSRIFSDAGGGRSTVDAHTRTVGGCNLNNAYSPEPEDIVKYTKYPFPECEQPPATHFRWTPLKPGEAWLQTVLKTFPVA